MRAYASSKGLKYNELLYAPSKIFFAEFMKIHNTFQQIFQSVQHETNVLEILFKEIIKTHPLPSLKCTTEHKILKDSQDSQDY